MIYKFFIHPGYTFNLLFTEAARLGSRGRLHDRQNNWRELRLDSTVMTNASGEITQMFPAAKQTTCNPSQKTIISWIQILTPVQKGNISVT